MLPQLQPFVAKKIVYVDFNPRRLIANGQINNRALMCLCNIELSHPMYLPRGVILAEITLASIRVSLQVA